MKRFFLPLLAAAALVVALAHAQDAATDLKRLEANWLMTYGEYDGVPFPEDVTSKNASLWKGNTVVMILPYVWKEPLSGNVALDPSKRPAEIDFVGTNGPFAGKKMYGIYEIQGNGQYRVCLDTTGKTRPKTFNTQSGSKYLLHSWRRAPG